QTQVALVDETCSFRCCNSSVGVCIECCSLTADEYDESLTCLNRVAGGSIYLHDTTTHRCGDGCLGVYSGDDSSGQPGFEATATAHHGNGSFGGLYLSRGQATDTLVFLFGAILAAMIVIIIVSVAVILVIMIRIFSRAVTESLNWPVHEFGQAKSDEYRH